MSSSLTSNLRTTSRSLLLRVELPTSSTWVDINLRLPLTIFERTGVAGHQNLARSHLAYCDLLTDRQQRAYDIVREHHAVTGSRVERRNSALSDALCPVPKFAAGGWVLVYNTAATIHQGTKTDTDAKVPKGQAIAQLDGALQSRRSWALFLR